MHVAFFFFLTRSSFLFSCPAMRTHVHPLQEDEFEGLGRSAQRRHAQEVAPTERDASTAARRLPAANAHLARGDVSTAGGAGDGVTLAGGSGGAPHVPRVLVQFCVS